MVAFSVCLLKKVRDIVFSCCFMIVQFLTLLVDCDPTAWHLWSWYMCIHTVHEEFSSVYMYITYYMLKAKNSIL